MNNETSTSLQTSITQLSIDIHYIIDGNYGNKYQSLGLPTLRQIQLGDTLHKISKLMHRWISKN
jgi:hypothetical protein